VTGVPPWIGETARALWLRAADTGLLGYRHRLSPLGFGSPPVGVAQQAILDLDGWNPPAAQMVRLVSHPYRSSALPSYPSIETWALVDGVSCGQAAAYRQIQFHTIRRGLRSDAQSLQGAYAVFPHLSSHFGHWVGDQLGAILWFASDRRITAGGRRLLVTAPSPQWAAWLEQRCPPGSLELWRPEQLLRQNLLLTNALLLPRLSPWQALALARDSVGVALASAAPQGQLEKLFLTSLRPERIANLELVCALFQRYGYTVLDPTGVPIAELLQRLRGAQRLWCEHGSMVLNPMLCRSLPYRVLQLDPVHVARHDAAAVVLGGGLYNAFQRALQRPFSCPPADPAPGLDRRLHPYQRQLQPDLVALEQALLRDAESLL
jgi:capsular polysaccharide biosynthesis protein